MFFNNAGSSTLDTYFKNIKEAGSMGASLALAMTKSLYPRVDMDAIDSFANGTNEEAALDLISDAQKAVDKIAADVVERFQDVDLQPIGSDKSDDEKTDTDWYNNDFDDQWRWRLNLYNTDEFMLCLVFRT